MKLFSSLAAEVNEHNIKAIDEIMGVISNPKLSKEVEPINFRRKPTLIQEVFMTLKPIQIKLTGQFTSKIQLLI